VALSEIVEPGGQYEASDRRFGGYMMATLPLGDRWEFVLGARVESYDLNITSRDSTLTDRSQVDFVPSVNVLWKATDEMNLRAAFSQTVNRPEFRELSPFQFTEATSLRQLYGNPDLESATITAADLRWDFFPSAWELFSVSGFYKHMTDPIEQVFIAAASTAYSFQNAKAADILGVELDAQFRLGRWSPSLEGFSLNTNLALIDSDVEVRETGTFIPTSLNRPLEGQAPYVLNAGLNWGSSGGGWTAGVFYNRIGKRLTAAGGSGVPDIYLQPRNSVDASLRVPLGRSAYMQVKGTNLLDEDFLSQQSANGITQLQQVYATGRTIAVKLGWQVF
jgi:TonB-dependent receptor